MTDQSLCVLFIAFTMIIMRLHVVSAEATYTDPSSHVLTGNPWNIMFEETVATGFSLERVEKMPQNIWSVTSLIAFKSLDQQATQKAVLFISPPWAVIPTDSVDVRKFILSPDAWLVSRDSGKSDVIRPGNLADGNQMVTGEFDYKNIPFRPDTDAKPILCTTDVSNINAVLTKHPSISHVDLLRVNIPNEIFRAFSVPNDCDNIAGTQNVSVVTATDNNPSAKTAPQNMHLFVGVALLDATTEGEKSVKDHIYSGLVRVPGSDPFAQLTRSFTAITSQRYSFLSDTSVQVLEAKTSDTWGYTAVVTFQMEDGISNPQIVVADSVFAIASSVAASDNSQWRNIRCPQITSTFNGYKSPPNPLITCSQVDLVSLSSPHPFITVVLPTRVVQLGHVYFYTRTVTCHLIEQVCGDGPHQPQLFFLRNRDNLGESGNKD